MNTYECPYCKEYIIIYDNELNCRIFRHGVYKIDMKQIDSHASKIICDKLYNEKLIYGCGKPFMIKNINGKNNIEKCNYI